MPLLPPSWELEGHHVTRHNTCDQGASQAAAHVSHGSDGAEERVNMRAHAARHGGRCPPVKAMSAKVSSFHQPDAR